jgi:hypothetical protein
VMLRMSPKPGRPPASVSPSRRTPMGNPVVGYSRG